MSLTQGVNGQRLIQKTLTFPEPVSQIPTNTSATNNFDIVTANVVNVTTLTAATVQVTQSLTATIINSPMSIDLSLSASAGQRIIIPNSASSSADMVLANATSITTVLIQTNKFFIINPTGVGPTVTINTASSCDGLELILYNNDPALSVTVIGSPATVMGSTTLGPKAVYHYYYCNFLTTLIRLN